MRMRIESVIPSYSLANRGGTMTHTIRSVTQRQVHGDSDTHTRDWVTRYLLAEKTEEKPRETYCCSTVCDHAHIGNTYQATAAPPRAKIVSFLV